MIERYFKVKYGYSVADQVSIPESELEKAIYAQIKGTPTQLGNAYVNGRNIIAITPHWHKHTGWYDWFEPQTGEDFEQIKRDCPNYDGIIEHHKQRVQYLLSTSQENLIGKNIKTTGLSAPEVIKETHQQIDTKSLADKMRIK